MTMQASSLAIRPRPQSTRILPSRSTSIVRTSPTVGRGRSAFALVSSAKIPKQASNHSAAYCGAIEQSANAVQRTGKSVQRTGLR
jgi:hypothetical protein